MSPGRGVRLGSFCKNRGGAPAPGTQQNSRRGVRSERGERRGEGEVTRGLREGGEFQRLPVANPIVNPTFQSHTQSQTQSQTDVLRLCAHPVLLWNRTFSRIQFPEKKMCAKYKNVGLRLGLRLGMRLESWVYDWVCDWEPPDLSPPPGVPA